MKGGKKEEVFWRETLSCLAVQSARDSNGIALWTSFNQSGVTPLIRVDMFTWQSLIVQSKAANGTYTSYCSCNVLHLYCSWLHCSRWAKVCFDLIWFALLSMYTFHLSWRLLVLKVTAYAVCALQCVFILRAKEWRLCTWHSQMTHETGLPSLRRHSFKAILIARCTDVWGISERTKDQSKSRGTNQMVGMKKLSLCHHVVSGARQMWYCFTSLCGRGL